MTHPYVVEEFSAEERAVLTRFFTNTDKPVFALRNLPEAVKGALFARYSRTAKSLRRLFLDEFYRGEDVDALAEVGAQKASELYDRIFIEFGDDSIAQLGGAHIAVEQASNVLTKAVQWSRLAAYLEQSTRYIAYDDRPGGRWRYYRDPDIAASAHGDRYAGAMDAIFAGYAAALPLAKAYFERRFPRDPSDTPGVYNATIRAKACDSLRGMLPASTVSNMGIYATGQAYEMMIMRMMASPLAEVRETAELMLSELNEVIPVFLRRVDQPDRGGAWIEHFRSTREQTASAVAALLEGAEPEPADTVTLTEWDPDGEEKVVAAVLYAAGSLTDAQCARIARGMPAEDRVRLLRAYCGERANRRHKPGRAFERTGYRFDVLGDYGAFRDLQRHRMLTIEWQELGTAHGYVVPPEVEDAGLGPAFTEAMERSAEAFDAIVRDLPRQAPYAVCMAYRIRYAMQMNAREAMHLVELRSSAQGHPAYRAIAHDMYAQIRDVAGHRAIAAAMSHVDTGDVDLERLEAERRAERKRSEAGTR